MQGREKALEAVEQCLKSFRIAPTTGAALQAALEMRGGDFEDNVQIASAILLDTIVTRDEHGFAHSSVEVVKPREFLNRL
jgi:hypothetical protein